MDALRQLVEELTEGERVEALPPIVADTMRKHGLKFEFKDEKALETFLMGLYSAGYKAGFAK